MNMEENKAVCDALEALQGVKVRSDNLKSQQLLEHAVKLLTPLVLGGFEFGQRVAPPEQMTPEARRILDCTCPPRGTSVFCQIHGTRTEID